MREEEIREQLAKQLIMQIRENSSKDNADPLLPDQIRTERDNVSDAATSHTHQRIAKSHSRQYATSVKRRATLQKFVSAGNQEKSHD